ncbi:MAG: asparagine synthase (glutamine-hydrolyzing) [Desulfobacteraceae bacterium]|nr:asparagine synthase (glutamine-hydrolyzing) [Desulfobacteraceae bacterium]
MCGIAGLLNPKEYRNELSNILWNMSDKLVHRGPDDKGVWIDSFSGVGLAHRRLSILDLSPEGHQPMISSCGRFVITYNGEIYNFKELRKELEIFGHCFRGNSDTEVILAAIAQWGIERAVEKFIGMFAFGLWDKKEQKMSLVRDRLGIKPLYYYCDEHMLIFGSELKALRAYDRLRPEVDRKALAEMLRLGYIPGTMTIYKEVKKLPPGMMLHIYRRDESLITKGSCAFWALFRTVENSRKDSKLADKEKALSGLEQRLKNAVKLRMIADVPLGAFLSGGIDSSTVAALMQSQSGQPVKTFSIGFKDKAYDEAFIAKAVARHLGTDHHELYIGESDLLNLVPEIPGIFDEPFADPSQLPTQILSQLTRKYVTVALSGDGGDELFAGYVRHFQARHLDRITRTLPPALRNKLGSFISAVPAGKWDSVFNRISQITSGKISMRLPGDKMHKLGDFLTAQEKYLYEGLVSEWKKTPVLGLNNDTIFSENWWQFPSGNLDCAEEFMYRDAVRYLPDDVLTKVDRTTMSVALEARVPLLDHQVVEYVWSLPLEMKLYNGKSKLLLRSLLSKYVPAELWDRPKMGFAVPLTGWLLGPLRDWAQEMLSSDRLKRECFLDVNKVRHAWKSLESGHSCAQYQIWNVLMFQSWLEKWM